MSHVSSNFSINDLTIITIHPRLRDASAHEKHNHQKILKEAETFKTEVIELQRTKDRLEARCADLQAQITDLHEQV